MGVPELQALWDRLQQGAVANTLEREERVLAKKFAKAVRHLGANPRHPGLQSHEIADLTKRYGQKVFESYLENDTSAAGRLFWTYGPEPKQLTVIGLEPHPEDAKNKAYDRVRLSALPTRAAAQAAAQVAAQVAAQTGAPRDASSEQHGGRRGDGERTHRR